MLSRIPRVPEFDAAHREEVHSAVGSLHSFVDLFERVQTARWSRLILLAVLNLADCATTLWFLSKGGSEANPLLAPVVHHWWVPIVVKTIVWLAVSRAVIRASVRAQHTDRLLIAAVAYYLGVVAWNLSVVAGL